MAQRMNTLASKPDDLTPGPTGWKVRTVLCARASTHRGISKRKRKNSSKTFPRLRPYDSQSPSA